MKTSSLRVRPGLVPLGSLVGWTLLVLFGSMAPLESQETLEGRIARVMDRPEFRHAHFGIEFYSLDRNEPVFQLNADKLFTPASTTKLVTMGASLELLGADYRFSTRVYRTGPVLEGVIDGDVVLVASGDPNLSGRIREDDSLVFVDHDHAYGGPGVEGDALLAIRSLARQIAGAGIERILGNVVVDASLFPEGDRELGSGVVISPMVVNDNIVDVMIGPGAARGASAVIRRSPVTTYVRFVNRIVTAPADAERSIRIVSDEVGNRGLRTVTLEGTVPQGSELGPFPYRVPVPTRYAEVLLTEALRVEGVAVGLGVSRTVHDTSLTAFRRPDRLLAEHVSPPFAEEVKVTLKVSQNLHASMVPSYLAALVSPGAEDRTGFDEIREFLEGAGLDLSGARQGDGAGGDAHFTPSFMVSFLEHMAEQESFPVFHVALPVLGRDGTLVDIQTDSPAAGHVHAKTGTYVLEDPLNRGAFLTAKGLAGYLTTSSGERLAFAIYVNNVPLEGFDAIGPVVGQAVGEIAAAAYDARW